MKQQKHMTACRGIHSHQVNSDTNPGGKKYRKKQGIKNKSGSKLWDKEKEHMREIK